MIDKEKQREITPNSITFQIRQDSTPVIEFKSNGDIYVKGNLIENDKELVCAMREYLNNIKEI